MRDRLPEFSGVTLRPIFVEVMPPFDLIKDGELWVSHKHRTINPALSMRLWRTDGAVPPSQSMACLF